MISKHSTVRILRTHLLRTRNSRMPNLSCGSQHTHRTRTRTCTSVIAALLSVLALAPAGLGAQTTTQKVALKFKAMVGNEAFACGTSYKNIGTNREAITPSDFTMYVHKVSLITDKGATVPVTLTQDVYQNGDVAMLDFEDGKGACSNGNAATHTQVEGTVPEGRYVGVQFTVGVPFERNHLEITTAPSPLTVTRMYWAWNSGYTFLRFDAKTGGGKSLVMHLGSAGCMPRGMMTPPTSCSEPNRPTIELRTFDIGHDAVVVDAAAFFAPVSVAENVVCMSSPRDTGCAPMFAAYGIPFKGTAATPQTLFRRASTAPAESKP